MTTMNYQRDGFMPICNQGGAPNYFPNSFNGPQECSIVKEPPFPLTGDVDRYDPENEDDFGQATMFWRDILDADAKTRLVNNMVASLKAASTFIVERAVRNFFQVDTELGRRLTEELRKAGKPISMSAKSANL